MSPTNNLQPTPTNNTRDQEYTFTDGTGTKKTSAIVNEKQVMECPTSMQRADEP